MDMKISNVLSAYDVYRADKPSASTKTAKSESKKDEVALSSKAKDFQTALAALANAPDIREDKVKQLKAKLDAGQYNVSAGDVAGKLLENAALI